jgi:hypothetical protein
LIYNKYAKEKDAIDEEHDDKIEALNAKIREESLSISAQKDNQNDINIS